LKHLVFQKGMLQILNVVLDFNILNFMYKKLVCMLQIVIGLII